MNRPHKKECQGQLIMGATGSTMGRKKREGNKKKEKGRSWGFREYGPGALVRSMRGGERSLRNFPKGGTDEGDLRGINTARFRKDYPARERERTTFQALTNGDERRSPGAEKRLTV